MPKFEPGSVGVVLPSASACPTHLRARAEALRDDITRAFIQLTPCKRIQEQNLRDLLNQITSAKLDGVLSQEFFLRIEATFAAIMSEHSTDTEPTKSSCSDHHSESSQCSATGRAPDMHTQ